MWISLHYIYIYIYIYIYSEDGILTKFDIDKEYINCYNIH